jgi:hypothetical protein
LRSAFFRCVKHVRQLGGESPLPQSDGDEGLAKRKGKTTLAARRAGKKRGAKTRADEQEPDTRPAVAGERANDCEAHIHQAHWW